MKNVLLMKADLTDADLAPMKIRDRDGNLTGDEVSTDLADANLNGANLNGANLTQANLRSASLRFVRSKNVNLADAKLDPGVSL